MDPNKSAPEYGAEQSPYAGMPSYIPHDPKARPNVYPRPAVDPEKIAIIPAANKPAQQPLDYSKYFRGESVQQQRRIRDNMAAQASASAAAAAAAASTAAAASA
ncbi:unnamed protein product, partial [Agarophyton chilense]